MTKFSAYLTGCSSAPSQIRHPERSADIYPITNGQSFPTTNYEPNNRAEPRDLRFSGPFGKDPLASLGMTKLSAYLTGCSSAPSQIRHPERSAAPIYPITNGLLRGVEGPRRCLLVHALQSFPTTNYEPNKIPSGTEGSAVQRTSLGNVFLALRCNVTFASRGKRRAKTPRFPPPALCP
jgi:hypothetical protein